MISKMIRILLLAVIAFAAYAIFDTDKNNQRYEELKTKDKKELTSGDIAFLSEMKKRDAEAEVRRKNHEKEMAAEEKRNKPQRELLELKLAVRVACEDTAKSRLKYPDSFEDEQHEDGVSNESGKNIYYYTLHYSSVNSFNVRSVSTIECYGMVGDPERRVTYRTFD